MTQTEADRWLAEDNMRAWREQWAKQTTPSHDTDRSTE